mgnify:CR=1 FL=1
MYTYLAIMFLVFLLHICFELILSSLTRIWVNLVAATKKIEANKGFHSLRGVSVIFGGCFYF